MLKEKLMTIPKKPGVYLMKDAIMLPYPGTEIYAVKYEGDRWEIRDKYLGEVRVAYGNVIEVEVPLEYIGNPTKVNLLVWYPAIAPWGGMEVDIVDWGK
jgi:hypothetical protein